MIPVKVFGIYATSFSFVAFCYFISWVFMQFGPSESGMLMGFCWGGLSIILLDKFLKKCGNDKDIKYWWKKYCEKKIKHWSENKKEGI